MDLGAIFTLIFYSIRGEDRNTHLCVLQAQFFLLISVLWAQLCLLDQPRFYQNAGGGSETRRQKKRFVNPKNVVEPHVALALGMLGKA
jgi:hypothetical protein